jgi:hypothetical protein
MAGAGRSPVEVDVDDAAATIHRRRVATDAPLAAEPALDTGHRRRTLPALMNMEQ